MAVTTLDYVPEAGKVLIDDHKGHPGIKATNLSYGQINDDMLEMLEKPHPSYFLLLLGFLLAGALAMELVAHLPESFFSRQQLAVGVPIF